MSGVQAGRSPSISRGSHIMGFNGQAIVAVAGRDQKSRLTTCGAQLIRPARFSCPPDEKSSTAYRRNSSLMIRMESTIRSA